MPEDNTKMLFENKLLPQVASVVYLQNASSRRAVELLTQDKWLEMI